MNGYHHKIARGIKALGQAAPLMDEQKHHIRMFEFKDMKRHKASGFFVILTEVIEELLSKGKKA